MIAVEAGRARGSRKLAESPAPAMGKPAASGRLAPTVLVRGLSPPPRGSGRKERRVEAAVARKRLERDAGRARLGTPRRGNERRDGCLSLLFGIATIAAATMAVRAPAATAVPTPTTPTTPTTPPSPIDLGRAAAPEDVYEDADEDLFPEEYRPMPGPALDEADEPDVVGRSIARALGLERIPDPSKANVSQAEYVRAHTEYLMKTQPRSPDRGSFGSKTLHVFPATAYPGNETRGDEAHRRRLFFPVDVPGPATVEHATLRLLLHESGSEQLDALLYSITAAGARELICRRRLEPAEPRGPRWIELDASPAASRWIDEARENLGLELELRAADGSPARRGLSSPFLNVIAASGPPASARSRRSTPDQVMSLHKGRRTKCKGESRKCCRHELTVMFKELKGFEFIVYPKTFDAGYCKGRCPPRYNPAHHHALLQSLLWKEDRKKVPKPCCAPSKLDQLMIVYFDENDSTQLKVSYWKNIRVLECACS